jgi:thioester reductase-like protein
MSTFLTGATGYLGSYAAADLLRQGEELQVLVRAKDAGEAEEKLWSSLQLHFGAVEFREHLRARLRIVQGDVTLPRLGLDDGRFAKLAATARSIIHCAASLNRRSERVCLAVNLRGTLNMIELARAADSYGLRRFTFVSTVAVAGHRAHETVREEDAIDWNRADYDPYARTKKFGEEMVRRLLPAEKILILRPSIVLGDSGRPETTQFDMVRAFDFLSRLAVLPLRPADRIDIVPANWVGRSIVTLHRKERLAHDTYHLSAGAASPEFREITRKLAVERRAREPLFLPALERPFAAAVRAMSRNGPGPLRRGAALLDVFIPYLVWDTVFDNARVVAEAGGPPAAFPSYCVPLLRFARRHQFRYPFEALPANAGPRGAGQ